MFDRKRTLLTLIDACINATGELSKRADELQKEGKPQEANNRLAAAIATHQISHELMKLVRK